MQAPDVPQSLLAIASAPMPLPEASRQRRPCLSRQAHRLLRLGALCALCGAGLPAVANAQSVDLRTTTLLGLRPGWRSGNTYTETPLIQWMGLTARGVDGEYVQDLRFQLVAWGQLLPEPLSGHRGEEDPSTLASSADVELAYVQARILDRRVQLTVGRQIVTGGATRMLQLDGAQVDARLVGKLGLSAYGGVQTQPRFGATRGEAAVGSRLYYRHSFETEVGASIIQLLDGGLVARRDAGVDARWTPLRPLALTASGVWSLVERGQLVNAELAAHWSLLPRLRLTADLRRSSPDLYVPRSSIFSVFSEEQRDLVGGGVSWDALESLGLYGEYHVLRTEQGSGHDVGVQGTLRLSRRASVGAHTRLLAMPVNGYLTQRLWLQHALSDALSLSLFGEATRLENPINEQRSSLTTGASVCWALTPRWKALLSGSIGTTPLFRSRYELTTRLSYELPWQAQPTPRKGAL